MTLRRTPPSPARPPRCHLRTGGRSALPLSLLSVVVLLAGGVAPLHGQSVEEQIRTLAGPNLEAWARPLTDGLARAVGTGWFDAARPLDALGFDLSIHALVARPGEGHRTFTAVLPASVSIPDPDGGTVTFTDPWRVQGGGSGVTPTAVGEGEGIRLVPDGDFRAELEDRGENPDDLGIRFPAGLDLRAIPAATLSLNVGVGLGTEVAGRWLPSVDIDPDLGSIGLTGLAIRQDLTRWFSFPLDLSASHGRQELTAGDWLTMKTRENWLVAGRTLGPISVFGGGGWRSTTTTVRYTVENPDDRPGLPPGGVQEVVDLSLDRSLAWNAGMRLQLLMMNVAAQYVWDDMESFQVRIGLGTP